MRRVVVTGLGAVTPLGVGVKQTWARLLAAESGIVSVAHWEPQKRWKDLTSTVAGVVPKANPSASGRGEGLWNASDWLTVTDQRRMSLFSQYAAAAADMALDDASWKPTRQEDLEATGVCIGSGIGNLEELYDTALAFEEFVGKILSRRIKSFLLTPVSSGLPESDTSVCAKDPHKSRCRARLNEVRLPGPKSCSHHSMYHWSPLCRRCLALHCLWGCRCHGRRRRRGLRAPADAGWLREIEVTVYSIQPLPYVKLPPVRQPAQRLCRGRRCGGARA